MTPMRMTKTMTIGNMVSLRMYGILI
jgi:hypothetical protein